jgi:hypothetical protein
MCNLFDEMLLPESLIADLAQSLPFPAQAAFRQAALAAMARLEVVGPGNLYRALVPIQASHFDPPSGERAAFDIATTGHKVRVSKLLAEPAIEHAYRGPGGRPNKRQHTTTKDLATRLNYVPASR